MPPFRPVDYFFSLQAIFLLGNGIYSLLLPESATVSPSPLHGTPIATVHALSMTSLTLSAMYFITVYQRNRLMMASAVPLRAMAGFVLWGDGGEWAKVAVYEAAMGALVAGSLLWERRWY